MKRTAPLKAASGPNGRMLHEIVVALPAINIDTDAIFPKQFLKTVKRTGLQDALFADWRFGEDGTPNGDFVLNKPGFAAAKILIGGDNFGCGSSREHAVWALKDYGFKVLISTSFGGIFRDNCIKNGVWPLTVSQVDLDVLVRHGAKDTPQTITIDLENLLVFPGDGTTIRAHISRSDYNNLRNGMDQIDGTLKQITAIEAFEQRHLRRFPWVNAAGMTAP